MRELRARGRNTRRKLLDAGAEVFATKGFHAARVDDIVKLARTSHGTFYLYFPNKEELFAALAAEVAEEMTALAKSLGPLRPGDAGCAELAAWIDSFAGLYARRGAVIRAWTEAEIGGNEAGRIGTDLLTQFARIVADRVAAVAPADLDPGIATVALVALLERFNYYTYTRQVPVERATMVATLARVTQASLFGS